MTAALAAAALGCAVGGVWIARVDWVSFLAQRIGAARGTISPEALERLRQIDLRGILFLAAATLTLGAIAAQWLRARVFPRLLRIEEHWTPMSARKTFAWLMPLLCGAVVFARYHATLTHGFFRYDDFDFLSFARDYPLREAIWMPHGDHFYPLTRVLTSIAVHLWGVTAWPYNLGVLLCFWATAVLGCRLLGEFRASLGGQCLFVALFLFWSPWAEMLGGYYILSAYLFIAAASLAVVLSYRRWRETRRRRFAIFVPLGIVVSTLVDISGWYVPAALGVFLAADFVNRPGSETPRGWLAHHGGLLLGVSVAVGLSLGATVFFYAVRNPGLFLSMSGDETRSLGRLVIDFLYLLDVGLLVSVAVPFVYARLPSIMLVILASGALLTFGAFLVAVVRKANRPERITLAAIALVIAGSALMVNLGRPSEATFVVRWSAKHVCPAYLWLCLLLAAGWHILWSRTTGLRRLRMAEITCLLGGAFCLAQTAFGALGLAVSFPPFGYPAEIRDAVTRRRELGELRDKIIAPILRAGDQPITAPILDGAYIHRHHPSLFDYSLSRYLLFFDESAGRISFVRNSAMQPFAGPRVTTVPALRQAVSPAFLDLLSRDAELRRYYFAEIPLRAQPSETPPINASPSQLRITSGSAHANADGTLAIESDGNTSIFVHESPFDPEMLPRLYVAVERERRDGNREEIVLGVAFQNDFGGPELRGTLRLPASDRAASAYVVDLRQIYAFVLSRQIANARIILVQPGGYRVRFAELGR